MRSFGAFELCDHAGVVAELERIWEFPPDTFVAFRFWRRSNSEGLWVAAACCAPADGGEVEAIGIALTREAGRLDRLSTQAIRRFGHLAQRGVVDVSEADALRYLTGEDLDGYTTIEDRGTRIVRNAELGALGRARIDGGRLRCELPRAMRTPAPVSDAGPGSSAGVPAPASSTS